MTDMAKRSAKEWVPSRPGLLVSLRFAINEIDELISVDFQTGRRNWAVHVSDSSTDGCVTCASPALSEGRV
jgi:hypothetical protein